ncbi:acyltransferase [Maribacter sp. 2307UL18-2]|uniref:acyltransferase n=1 Tax=Maribacter sp. 2307UL18-2 TaxID=3386274 RepID=UPI0039BD8B82
MMFLIKKLRSLFYTALAKFSCRNWKAGLKANGYTKLSANTVIGKNVNFNGLVVYGKGKCIFGDNFHSGFGCKILTTYHNYEGEAIPYDSTMITRDVIIEDNVWLGIDVTILSGVTIGEGAIIQAGSTVVGDIPKMTIAGGHPAKAFSKRNEERYLELKEQKRFY